MCKFTARPIDSNDRASIQLQLAKLDSEGRMMDETDVIDICGYIRANGSIDNFMNEYAKINK